MRNLSTYKIWETVQNAINLEVIGCCLEYKKAPKTPIPEIATPNLVGEWKVSIPKK